MDDMNDLPHIDDPDVLMFEGLPVTGQGFKITGVTGGFDPRRQFSLAGLPSGTHVRGEWEGVVNDITYKKVKGEPEMLRVHHIKVGEEDVVTLTHIMSDLDDN